ncbi:involved in bacteriocin production or immunity [Bacillus phage Mgbh1]|uniref:Holin-like protein n=1 Tax=Bacillus phage Mgbh1 TaxID=1796993 RepID=A0A142F1N5_9CAUD|nr:involved in bacteriocin production or immunity [Bacillus phage Mgbh1]AMQ66692.1 holin-like protein [Bacillus phage Mgbh1]
MESEIIRMIISQGPFAVLFTWLLFRTEKRNSEREQRYEEETRAMRDQFGTERSEWRKERTAWTETLSKFSEKYDVIVDEVREIKTIIQREESE